ncbi:hypothetical protein [Biomaibacter acetigenes]|nr:hypothetical protein [Biomaibacter acetigenes]
MAKMIIDPEIYKRGIEKGKTIISQEVRRRRFKVILRCLSTKSNENV